MLLKIFPKLGVATVAGAINCLKRDVAENFGFLIGNTLLENSFAAGSLWMVDCVV